MARGTVFTRTMGAVIGLGLAVGGCSLGDKQRYADTLAAAPRAAARAGAVQVTIAATVSWESGAPAAVSAAPSRGVQRVTLRGWLDLERGRGELTTGSRPEVVFDGLTWYARRTDALPGEARPWVTFRAQQLEKRAHAVDPEQVPPLVGAAMVPTTFLVDLVGGSLAGSLSQVTATGGKERAYRGNFDIEKALKGTPTRPYDEHQRELVLTLLGFLGISDEPHHGTAWLDPQGRPVRFAVDLVEKPRHRVTIKLGLDIRLGPYGRHAVAPPPSADETVNVDSGIEFLDVVAQTLRKSPAGAAS